MKIKILITSLLLFTTLSNAQINETERTMLWTTFGVSKELTKKLDVSYNQLNSIDLKSTGINFIQPDLALSYALTKKWALGVNYTPTFSIDDVVGNQLVYHRVSERIKLKTKLGKRFRMRNYIVAEQHFTQRSKFKQRYYYRLNIYYRDTKLPWKFRPFIDQKLYRYANGRDLQYYNADGTKANKKAPNGLHAYRFQAGVKLYPSKKFSFMLYYLKQKEFNGSGNDINSLNPNSNIIRRPFYDFSVIGISCHYKL